MHAISPLEVIAKLNATYVGAINTVNDTPPEFLEVAILKGWKFIPENISLLYKGEPGLQYVVAPVQDEQLEYRFTTSGKAGIVSNVKQQDVHYVYLNDRNVLTLHQSCSTKPPGVKFTKTYYKMSGLYVRTNDVRDGNTRDGAYGKVLEEVRGASNEIPSANQFDDKEQYSATVSALYSPQLAERLHALGNILKRQNFPLMIAQTADLRTGVVLVKHGFKPIEGLLLKFLNAQ